MKYALKISSSDGSDAIVFDSENKLDVKITKLIVKLNSLDNDSRERDRDARFEITIEGTIDDVSSDEVCKIAKWSGEKENVFRNVDITVFDPSNGKTYRNYSFDKIFCVDYAESFVENKGNFVLYMVQSPNKNKSDIFSF